MQKKLTGLACLLMLSGQAAEAREITLVKRATRIENLSPENYKIQAGDTLWKIMMRHYDAKPEELPALYKEFRKLNPEITDLNRLMAGQKVVIPKLDRYKTVNPQTSEVEDVYIVKSGDYLSKVLRNVYGLPDEVIFDEYLDLIKELNPEVKNPNHIKVGQRIRMPEITDDMRRGVTKKQPQAAPKPSPKPTPAPAPEPEVVKAPPIQPTAKPVAPKAEIKPEPAAPPAEPQSEAKLQLTSQIVQQEILPAFEEMGGRVSKQGTYFMPLPSGSSISIDTADIPVMELDTGQRIILDSDNKISPDVKNLIEEGFPSVNVLSGQAGSVDEMMDRTLSASGYFSINKDAAPLLVGNDEKVSFKGEWIVYKDFSRRNIFVINTLEKDEERTPKTIKRYASRFGIDLIELGGKDPQTQPANKDYIKDVNHSYEMLFALLQLPVERDTRIKLVEQDPIHISYEAPLMVGQTILTNRLPDDTIQTLLKQRGYTLIYTKDAQLAEVLDAMDFNVVGPPVKMKLANGRTTINLPAIQLGPNIILKKAIDPDISKYLASQGLSILIW